jgi:8-oxo-dGTP pyrophosphatase MutT (NUDIX family)
MIGRKYAGRFPQARGLRQRGSLGRFSNLFSEQESTAPEPIWVLVRRNRVVQSVVMRAPDSRLPDSRWTDSRWTKNWSPTRPPKPSAKFFRLSQLRRMRGSEQVAAVCYRKRGEEIQFLLVQTRAGRWTFPKGHAEPGLTHAQAAALEAFEEAGVHGRMEEASFVRYVRNQRTRRSGEKSPEKGLAVNAYLCEVLRLAAPQESGRNPSWFSPEKTKRRLREARTPEYAAELARVVDRAVTRIKRLHRGARTIAERPRLEGPKFDPATPPGSNRDVPQKVHVMTEGSRKAAGASPSRATGRKSRRNVIPIDRR